jgi:hypothetical protein
MSPSGKALTISLISAVASPIFVAVELFVVVLVAMGTQDPQEPLKMHVAAVVAVLLFAALVFALPVAALVSGVRARRASRSGDTSVGVSRATAAVVIAAVSTAFVAITQVYLLLMAAGVCGLDGCY